MFLVKNKFVKNFEEYCRNCKNDRSQIGEHFKNDHESEHWEVIESEDEWEIEDAKEKCESEL